MRRYIKEILNVGENGGKNEMIFLVFFFNLCCKSVNIVVLCGIVYLVCFWFFYDDVILNFILLNCYFE